MSCTTFERDSFKAMMSDIESGKVSIVITKDLSRLGRDYLKTGEYIEIIFPENDVMIFRNVFNDFYARDCSKKIRAVFKAKGNSGKPLATRPPYGYKKSEFDKDVWVVDDEAAQVVRQIFQMCIEGFGPSHIARKLSEQQVLIPTAYLQSKGRGATHTYPKPYRWYKHTVAKTLESMGYAGHTVNFKSQIKSYKCKKRINHAKEDWVVFENTHEPIISQHDFDLVQELRKNKRKIQRCGEINPFQE